jgi:hypothetical protein
MLEYLLGIVVFAGIALALVWAVCVIALVALLIIAGTYRTVAAVRATKDDHGES